MKPKKTLLIACLGYLGIWLIFPVLIHLTSSNDETIIRFFVGPIFLSLAGFYPPAAFSFILYKQSQLKRWLYISYGSIAAGVLFGAWIVIDQLNGGGKGYDGFKYLLTFPIGFLSSNLIVGFASIAKNQKSITRKLGVVTILTLLYWPVITSIEKSSSVFQHLPNFIEMTIFIPFWLNAALLLITTFVAVYWGLEETNSKTLTKKAASNERPF